jgi:hypothetical protein
MIDLVFPVGCLNGLALTVILCECYFTSELVLYKHVNTHNFCSGHTYVHLHSCESAVQSYVDVRLLTKAKTPWLALSVFPLGGLYYFSLVLYLVCLQR